VIGAALWVAIALPAALAYDMFYDVNERCYQQSLDDVLHDTGEGSATGCVPAVAFVILGAARYGPAVLLVPSADINRQAPFLSGLFFAALSALAFALAGRRAGQCWPKTPSEHVGSERISRSVMGASQLDYGWGSDALRTLSRDQQVISPN